MLKILITGGTGMVGRNLIDYLVQFSEFKVLFPSKKELNLLNIEELIKYLQIETPDIIVHSAGLVGGIQANIDNPVKFLIENLEIGKNLLLAAQQTKINRIINLGSSCMYPKNYNKSLKEEYILEGPLEPTNEGYALAKIITLKLSNYIMQEDTNFMCKTLIPCNLYGKYDKFNVNQSHLIPAIIHKIHKALVNNSKEVEIWGDGSARREFMYAEDLSKAIFKAIINFDTLPNIMNIGIGQDFTIDEYYKSVAKVIGWNGNFIYNISKPVGMKRKLVNIEKQTLWGWKPEEDLITGLKKTYSYYLEQIQ